MAFDFLEETWVTESVRAAFDRVPFERMTREADGSPVIQTTAPSMMARMLCGLRVEPGMDVLEIGTGSGYNAALLYELVGSDGKVTTIEVDPQVSVAARKRLDEIGCPDVHCIVGDGWQGWNAEAPYARILAACKPASLPNAWVDQLCNDGILVTPLDSPDSPTGTIIAYFRKSQGRLEKLDEHVGGFIPMTRTPL